LSETWGLKQNAFATTGFIEFAGCKQLIKHAMCGAVNSIGLKANE